MRSLVVVAALAALAGCSTVDPGQAPTKVSWDYGAGNGDGVAYPGPAPVFKRAYGLEADAPTKPAQEPKVNYSWGAENQSGGMVQQDASTRTQQATAPTPAQQPATSQTAAPGTHS